MRFKLNSLWKEAPGCWLDFTHTKIDEEGIRLLIEVAKEAKVVKKIDQMFSDEIINVTEKR